MKVKQVWAVYWSATGTTEKVVLTAAKAAAEWLGIPVEIYDWTLPPAREKELSFTSTDLVFFATPTYAGRVPNVLLPFLREKVKGGGALAVPVVLFGNRNYDDSLIELRDILETDGFHTVAGAAFVGEHSFSRILGAGRPDAEDLSVTVSFGTQTADKVHQMTQLPAEPAAVKGETPIRPYYTPRDRHGAGIDIRKVRPKTSDSCTNCGTCAAVCPMGSIDPKDVRNFTGICIKCCACEKKCPVGAKYFDDPGYLYHKTELEEIYSRRAEPELFV